MGHGPTDSDRTSPVGLFESSVDVKEWQQPQGGLLPATGRALQPSFSMRTERVGWRQLAAAAASGGGSSGFPGAPQPSAFRGPVSLSSVSPHGWGGAPMQLPGRHVGASSTSALPSLASAASVPAPPQHGSTSMMMRTATLPHDREERFKDEYCSALQYSGSNYHAVPLPGRASTGQLQRGFVSMRTMDRSSATTAAAAVAAVSAAAPGSRSVSDTGQSPYPAPGYKPMAPAQAPGQGYCVPYPAARRTPVITRSPVLPSVSTPPPLYAVPSTYPSISSSAASSGSPPDFLSPPQSLLDSPPVLPPSPFSDGPLEAPPPAPFLNWSPNHGLILDPASCSVTPPAHPEPKAPQQAPALATFLMKSRPMPVPPNSATLTKEQLVARAPAPGPAAFSVAAVQQRMAARRLPPPAPPPGPAPAAPLGWRKSQERFQEALEVASTVPNQLTFSDAPSHAHGLDPAAAAAAAAAHAHPGKPGGEADASDGALDSLRQQEREEERERKQQQRVEMAARNAAAAAVAGAARGARGLGAASDAQELQLMSVTLLPRCADLGPSTPARPAAAPGAAPSSSPLRLPPAKIQTQTLPLVQPLTTPSAFGDTPGSFGLLSDQMQLAHAYLTPDSSITKALGELVKLPNISEITVAETEGCEDDDDEDTWRLQPPRAPQWSILAGLAQLRVLRVHCLGELEAADETGIVAISCCTQLTRLELPDYCISSAASIKLLATMPRLQHLAVRRLQPEAPVFLEQPCRWAQLALHNLPDPEHLLRLPLGSLVSLTCRCFEWTFQRELEPASSVCIERVRQAALVLGPRLSSGGGGDDAAELWSSCEADPDEPLALTLGWATAAATAASGAAVEVDGLRCAAAQVQLLEALMPLSGSLKMLRLRNWSLDPTLAPALADAAPRLTTLTLDGCSAGAAGAGAFWPAIAAAPPAALRRLDLLCSDAQAPARRIEVSKLIAFTTSAAEHLRLRVDEQLITAAEAAQLAEVVGKLGETLGRKLAAPVRARLV